MGTAPVALRPLRPADLPLLAHWLQDPDVSDYYTEPADVAHLAAKYGPRMRGEEPVRVHLVVADGAGVGFAQHYLLPDDERRRLRLSDDRVWGGFDLFIGDRGARGRGLGLATVRTLLDALRVEGATAVAVDAWVANTRAIRCYERAGLHVARHLPRHERWRGSWREHVLMTADFRGTRPLPPAPAP